MNKYLTEFLGTFFLVFSIAFSGNPLAIGFTLAVCIYMGGHISGAHYNPAVSTAVLIRGKMAAKDYLPYIISQLLGAIAATLVFTNISGKTFLPAPATDVNLTSALILEFLGTFLLGSVVLAVATSKKLDGNYVYGFAIGLTVTAMALSVGTLTGGAFNPAVGIGPGLAGLFLGGMNLSNIVLYLVGPMLGGIASAFAYKFINQE